MTKTARFQKILGIRFFAGDERGAIDEISRGGGLLVVPAAPALVNLAGDQLYCEALQEADFAIADSALMVLLWNLIESDRLPKLSGLKYLRTLVHHPEFGSGRASFWIMPSVSSAERNLEWLKREGVEVADGDVYIAPKYGMNCEDRDVLRRIEERRPRHVVICVGGGVQEKLGCYLKKNLSYRPSIHCTGAAIAFLSGDQVHIPIWTDKLGLGWLWRCISDPKRFVPRYWNALFLIPMMLRHRTRLPLDSQPDRYE